ncbi:MAG: imidazole glycerol phosphate synthase subunit HisF [Bacteroidales bacterium]|nr:imidazole glycerol phosphate synthase subunit HisF [Bacteroidales bacterium]
MVAKRIIPCLDVKDGKTVKGINFLGLREVGDPVELGAYYSSQGADELVYLDISATIEGRNTFTGLVRSISERIDIPFTVGGGIGSLSDAARLLEAGADKVTVNSAAIRRPSLIEEIAGHFGSQFVVVAIDAKTVGGRWIATTDGGRNPTDRELFEWASEAESRGAGEILFTSMDHDGTKAGYPISTFASLCESLSIPVIASGGAGSVEDIAEVLTEGKADAALAASIFHYGEITIPDLKARLASLGIPVRT